MAGENFGGLIGIIISLVIIWVYIEADNNKNK